MTSGGGGPAIYAMGLLVDGLREADAAVTDMEHDATLAAQAMKDGDLADAVAVVQDLRKRLGNVERDLVTALGRRVGKRSGELSDGRTYDLKRGQDRKTWDHDDWKRDVRRQVVAQVVGEATLVVVDPESGEEVMALRPMLQAALALAQDVHGAQAPKSTALKRLGLYVGDYCESSPAGWNMTVTPKPDPKPTATDQEK